MASLRSGRRRVRRTRGDRGFTFVELIVGLTLFAGVSLFLLQAFMNGMTYANRSDEKAAGTSIAMQIMEQIKASPNPYTMVGFTDIVRTSLPLPAPYNGIANPTPHTFQASVTVTPDDILKLSAITVNVYRPQDPDTAPLVTLSTILDAQ
ncbi:MAG TPA: prepilin-type N-terminal cleavage/methylation domain-containing protein [bacterium]|nr:prepilin-type N-terminal cleavage/methylation domain-containing protein [bacterium]